MTHPKHRGSGSGLIQNTNRIWVRTHPNTNRIGIRTHPKRKQGHDSSTHKQDWGWDSSQTHAGSGSGLIPNTSRIRVRSNPKHKQQITVGHSQRQNHNYMVNINIHALLYNLHTIISMCHHNNKQKIFDFTQLGRTAATIIIIIDNFCIALFSGVPKLTALYNILQHFLNFTNIIHIIMTTNNV